MDATKKSDYTPTNVFQASGGTNLKYMDIGNNDAKSAETVLLIHGLGTSTLMFRRPDWCTPIIDGLLTKGFRVVAMDCRGHGFSDKPKESSSQYGLQIVRDHIELMDSLQIQTFHVAGWSMGAEIAIKMTTEYPDRVQSLCVYGSGWSYGTDWYDKSYGSFISPCASIWGCFLALVHLCWYPCCCCCIAKALNGEEPDLKALKQVCEGMKEIQNVTESELKSIDVPVLGIVGENDEELEYVQRMDIIKDFKFTVIPNKGHDEGCADPMHQEAFMDFYNR